MSVDRQRISAVARLQELGFKWDGTTWVSGEYTTSFQPVPPLYAPNPMNHVQGALAGLYEGIQRLRRELARHAVHTPPIPGHVLAGVRVERYTLRQTYNALTSDPAWHTSLATCTPAHPGYAPGLFRLDGVEFYEA